MRALPATDIPPAFVRAPPPVFVAAVVGLIATIVLLNEQTAVVATQTQKSWPLTGIMQKSFVAGPVTPLAVPRTIWQRCVELELKLSVGLTPAPEPELMTTIAFVEPVPPPPKVFVTAVQLCAPVHVGVIVWSIGGAASARMKEVELPLTAVRPTLPVGLAGLLPFAALMTPALATIVVPSTWTTPKAEFVACGTVMTPADTVMTVPSG